MDPKISWIDYFLIIKRAIVTNQRIRRNVANNVSTVCSLFKIPSSQLNHRSSLQLKLDHR